MTGVFHPVENSPFVLETQGLDLQNSVKALAGCGPSEERNDHYP